MFKPIIQYRIRPIRSSLVSHGNCNCFCFIKSFIIYKSYLRYLITNYVLKYRNIRIVSIRIHSTINHHIVHSLKTMAQTEAAKKAKEFHETLKVDAENRIVQKFPERIIHLNELLKMPEFRIAATDIKCKLEIPTIIKVENNVNNCEGKTQGKRPRLDSNSHDTIPGQMLIPANKKIVEVIKILKPNIKQLAEDTNALKMWVSLLIPKIEDGNNFGVSVQEDTLAEIQQVEVEATNYLEQMSRYYASRGKLISKVCKYPYIEDYRCAVEELDERQYLSMSLTMHEIRNRYSTLHDIVIKNFDKIKKPRSSNTDSLY